MKLDKIISLDLRDVWPNEAKDFTPWLAKEENLALLSKAIDIDITLEEKESSVGSFNVDIFAKEEDTGRNIVIENQLEDTNHDHLGKLITYASGKNAEIVIWIVKHARDEHRQAIEWLNNHTDNSSAFFLIEIELWKIGDSKPAPKFNVVERPNEWAKTVRPQANLSESDIFKADFWTEFRNYAETKPAFMKEFSLRKPLGWYDFAIGSSSVFLRLSMNTQKNFIEARVIIRNRELSARFKDANFDLENSVGQKRKWIENIKSDVILFSQIAHLQDRDQWHQDFDWFIEILLGLKKDALRILSDTDTDFPS